MSAPVAEVDEVQVDPRTARVYAEGWQSWSPATWHPVTAISEPAAEEWVHLMRLRPGTPVAGDGLQGEGLLVVDPGTGAPARCYGAAGPTAVPTVHARINGDRVRVHATGPVDATEHADGGEAALAAYAERLRAAVGARPLPPPPSVWCSWYRYFEAVTADDVEENLRAFDDHGLAVDVVQIDDGWSPGLGEGLRPAERFGSLPRLVDTIRGSGRRAGIWLAPFLVGADTTLARDHPDWLVGPAGRNWGQQVVGLDLAHPAVRELLADALARLVGLGVDYLKLDFLYGGAVPGRRHGNAEAVEAYRSGLSLVRETVGPDVYLVGCGAPLLPSVGLVDAMRVSGDTFHEEDEEGSVELRGLMAVAARSWQQGRWWANDPDCVVARPSYAQRERWASAALELGGLRSFSDRVAELDEWGMSTVRALLDRPGSAEPFSAEQVRAAAELARRERDGSGR